MGGYRKLVPGPENSVEDAAEQLHFLLLPLGFELHDLEPLQEI